MMPSFLVADALVSLKKSKAFSMVIPAKIQTYLTPNSINWSFEEMEEKLLMNLMHICKAGDHLALAKIFQEINKLPKETLKIMGDNGKIYAKQYFDKEFEH